MKDFFNKINGRKFAGLFLTAAVLTIAVPSAAVTVQEVARELECPCDCPLVLEDCNMSCGLDWKDEIGEMIRAGKTRDEIVQNFIDRYGDACRITPYKRIRGKIFQYTRGFDTKDWVILWGGVGVWGLVFFTGIFIVVRRWSARKKKDRGEGSQS